jgi:F420-dependent oxidoreductase-like protein
MDVGLMVEGQHGLTWERWTHIYRLAERLGFPSLFRSDHYFIGEQRDSLDTYTSLVLAARETTKLRFGTLVTPVTFRPPVEIGRMAAQIDLLSGGRLALGVGAGWNEPEHAAYGIPFPPPAERSARLEEAILLMKAMWGPGPASFEGRYYTLAGANPLPKPDAGRPWLIVGGSGPKRTLRTAARHGDEWNTVNATPETYAERVATLERHCEAEGRDPSTIKRSMMTFGIVGPNERAVEIAAEKAAKILGRGTMDGKALRASAAERGIIHGTTDQVVEQLGRLAELGLQEVEFQHMDFDDDSVPEYLAAEIAPRVRDL